MDVLNEKRYKEQKLIKKKLKIKSNGNQEKKKKIANSTVRFIA